MPEDLSPAEASPQATPPASPAPSAPPTPSVKDQYELGDVSDSLPEPVAQAGGEATPPASHAPRERDPETGRFAKPAHSKRALRMAQDMGVPQEEIDAASPEQLDDLVYHLNRQALDLARQHSRDDARLNVNQRGGRTPEPEAPAEGLGIDESQYDPGIVGVLKSQQETIKQLQARLEGLEGFARHEVDRRNESLAQKVDRVIEKIGRPEVYGTGRGKAMKSDQPEYLTRLALLGRANALGGITEENLLAADKAMFGTRAAPPPPNGGSVPAAEEWRNGGLARPTQRANPAEAPGERKALRTAQRVMKEQGLLDDDTDTDGFPS